MTGNTIREDITEIVNLSVELTNEPRLQSVEPRIQSAIIVATAILILAQAVFRHGKVR